MCLGGLLNFLLRFEGSSFGKSHIVVTLELSYSNLGTQLFFFSSKVKNRPIYDRFKKIDPSKFSTKSLTNYLNTCGIDVTRRAEAIPRRKNSKKFPNKKMIFEK